jgi:organic radical activating enzyme
MSIKVNEIFHSIQGEGQHAGINSVFLRTSGCDLSCLFCDTKYHKEGGEISLESIRKSINSFNSYNLVITGGEPLLWQGQLYALIKDLPHYVTIETNGTIVPSDELLKRVDEWSVSPKLNSSGNDIDKRLNYDALEVLKAHKAIFKFVVTNEKDVEEVLEICKQVRIDNHKVWLMPEGTTGSEILKKSLWVIELCKKHNFNYSARLHILIWGKKKGV